MFPNPYMDLSIETLVASLLAPSGHNSTSGRPPDVAGDISIRNATVNTVNGSIKTTPSVTANPTTNTAETTITSSTTGDISITSASSYQVSGGTSSGSSPGTSSATGDISITSASSYASRGTVGGVGGGGGGGGGGASSLGTSTEAASIADVAAPASRSSATSKDPRASRDRRRLKQQKQEPVGVPLTRWRNDGAAGSTMDAVVHVASAGGTALLFNSPDIEPYVQLDSAYMSFGSADTKIDWNTAGGKGWSIMAYARAPPSSTASSERLFEFSGGAELVNAISFGRAGTSSSGEYVLYGPGGSSEVQLRTRVPDLWNNEWRLVIATTTNSSFTVLVDGELAVSGPTSALVGSRTTSLNYVGRSSAAAVPFASGLQFRELNFWMVPLEPEEIDSLHQHAASQWGANVSDVPVMQQLREEAARSAPQPPDAMPPAAPQGSPPALALSAPQPQPLSAPQPQPQPQPQPVAMPLAVSPPSRLPPVKAPPAAKAPPVGQGANRTASNSSTVRSAPNSSSPASKNTSAASNSTPAASNSTSTAPSTASRPAGQGQQQQEFRGTPAAGYVSGLFISPAIRASATYKVRIGVARIRQCAPFDPAALCIYSNLE